MDTRTIAMSLFMMMVTAIILGGTGISLSIEQEGHRISKLYAYTQEVSSANHTVDEVNDKLEQALTASRQLLDRAEDDPDDYRTGKSREFPKGRIH